MPHRQIRQIKKVTLRRDLGLMEATFAGVGIILGAGIYALIGKGAGIAGNSLWLSFLIASLVAAFTGLSYAELSSRFPKDSGEYTYTQKAFSKRIGWLVAWLIIFQGVVSTAAVALGFAGYFNILFSNLFTLPLIGVAIGVIVLFSYVNFWGIKEAAWLNIVFTLLEAGGLIAIVLFGLKFIGRNINYLEMPFGYTGVFSAASLIFFAFIGFESIVKLSEETKNAKKIIPRALILSIIISTILYVLVAIAAVSIMGWEALGASSAPLAEVAAIAFGNKAFLTLSVIALFSTGNTILMIMVTTSRLMYGLGKEYKKLKLCARIHKIRRTPWIAVISVMIMAILFSLLGDIQLVAEITNFSVFAVFALVNASLISIRYKLPTPRKINYFRMPVNIGKFPILALIGILVSLFMLTHLSYIAIVGGIAISIIGYGAFSFVRK